MIEDKIQTWYEDNCDWVNEAYEVSLFEEYGFDVTESSIDTMPTDDFIEELYYSENNACN